MKERPILMSAPMVRAILNGSKNQTRRAMKPDGKLRIDVVSPADGGPPRCPYGIPGDRLWVREAWAPHPQDTSTAFYRATVEAEPGFPVWSGPWRPSIHMPRWASRITLEITRMRVERLQGISEGDAYEEGTALWAAETVRNGNKWPNIVRAYRGLWESINGPESWEANPWVWVVDFKRV